MPFIDDVNRLLRDHEGYTGDGQGGVGPLPVGDRSTARRAIWKRDLRDLLITLAQTMGDPSALQDILDELDGKADLANSGRFFTSRAAAVSIGQSALPGTLGLIMTVEDGWLAVRSFSNASDDPLFETQPSWGVALRAPNAATLAGALNVASVIPLINIGGTGNAITADLAVNAVAAGASVTASTSVRYIPAATNSNDTETDVTLFVAGDEPRIVRTADGARLPAGFFVVGRAYTLDRRGTIWRVATGDATRTELAGKADLPNAGKMFANRDQAVSFGQENLPAALSRMLIREGDYLALRGTAHLTDPLFDAPGPRWGIEDRYPSQSLVARLLIAAGEIPLEGVGGTENDITASIPAWLADAGISITGASVVRVVIAAANTGPVTLHVAGDEPRPVIRPNGQPLEAGDLLPLRGVVFRRSGVNWRLQGAGVERSQLGTAAYAPLDDMIRRTNMMHATVPRFLASGPGDAMVLTLASGLPNVIVSNFGLIQFAASGTSTAPDPTITINGVTRALKDGTGNTLPAGAIRNTKVYIAAIRNTTEARLVTGLDGNVDLGPVWTAINGKASLSSVESLSTVVEGKASQTDLDALGGVVDGLLSGTRVVGDWDAAGGVFPTVRPDASPVQAGDQFNVSGGGLVDGVVFAAGDILTALADGGGATYAGVWSRRVGTATQADQVSTTTPGRFVQAVLDDLERRASLRDFATFNLTDYLHPDDLAFALSGQPHLQDVNRVTAAVQQFHADAISAWAGRPGGYHRVRLVYLDGAIRINDEMIDEATQDVIWDTGWERRFSKLFFDFRNLLVEPRFPSAVGVRNSGIYREHGITYPVRKCVLRLMKKQISTVWLGEATGRMRIIGENNVHTDPDGVHVCNVNDANFMADIEVRESFGSGWIVESNFNSRYPGVISKSGWNPTEFGASMGLIPASVTFSNVGAVVTASEPIFEAHHAGRWFSLARSGLALPAVPTTISDHWSIIASVDNPTQITLASAPARDVTGARGSFESLRGSIGSGSNILTLSAPITGIDLTGHRVTVIGTYGTSAARGHILPAVIIAHSGDQLTLNISAGMAVDNAPLVFNAAAHVGPTELSPIGDLDQNDMLALPRLWTEDGGYGNKCGVQAILTGVHVDIDSGTKIHGCSTNNGNNYGGNFANAIVTKAKGFRFTGTSSHGGHSPRWGKHMFVGNNVDVDFQGESNYWPSNSHTAEIYLMPIDWDGSEPDFRVRYGMHVYSFGGDGFAQQTFMRSNGQALHRALRSMASDLPTRVPGGVRLPTYLDDVELRSLSVDGEPGVSGSFVVGGQTITVKNGVIVGIE